MAQIPAYKDSRTGFDGKWISYPVTESSIDVNGRTPSNKWDTSSYPGFAVYRLLEVPNNTILYNATGNNPVFTNYTETTSDPVDNTHVRVDYIHGFLKFLTTATAACSVTYNGLGSALLAKDVNEITSVVSGASGSGGTPTITLGSATLTGSGTTISSNATSITAASGTISAATLDATTGVTTNNITVHSGTNVTIPVPLNSTVATGNSPFTVASTTKVNNLQADTVDGYNIASGLVNEVVVYDPSNSQLKSSGSVISTKPILFLSCGSVGGSTNYYIENNTTNSIASPTTSMTDNTGSALNMTVTATVDTASAWTGTQYTVPVTGYYRLSIKCMPVIFNVSAAGTLEFRVYKNATGYKRIRKTLRTSGASFTTQNYANEINDSMILSLTSSDALIFKLFNNSSGTRIALWAVDGTDSFSGSYVLDIHLEYIGTKYSS